MGSNQNSKKIIKSELIHNIRNIIKLPNDEILLTNWDYLLFLSNSIRKIEIEFEFIISVIVLPDRRLAIIDKNQLLIFE